MDSGDDRFDSEDLNTDFTTLKHRMNLEIESMSVNQLYDLASEANQKKLIAAHGYRGGQYELLREGTFLLFSPIEAIEYLKNLLQED
jgi:hypothetical protein